MKVFINFTIAYTIFAVVLILFVREDPVNVLTSTAVRLRAFLGIGLLFLPIFSLLGIMINAVSKKRSYANVVISVASAIVGVLVFQNSFTLIKTTIPYVVPFFADPTFAEIDRFLHGGVDPWKLTHNWATELPIGSLTPVYSGFWIWVPAIAPVYYVLVDADEARLNRAVVVYLASWVVIGNVLAAMGSSVGPVFYDRLLDSDRFAELTIALKASIPVMDGTDKIQDYLWRIYTQNGQDFGSGISAFPSVHVSVAVASSLYLFERSKYFLPVGFLFVALILYLSVYTGYHYAIDGYVSIIFVVALWYIMLKRDRGREGQKI